LRKETDMAKFGLIRSFDIDDGQLDAESPQACFVLGYELGELVSLFDSNSELMIAKPVHAANAGRIRKIADEFGVDLRLTWMEGDSSETWMWMQATKRETC